MSNEHGWVVRKKKDPDAPEDIRDVVITPRPYQSKLVAEQFRKLVLEQGDGARKLPDPRALYIAKV